MSRPPTLYVAITNHGFGHATRTSAVVAEIQRRCPGIEIILATTAPRWLLQTYLQNPVRWRHVAFDVGVLQSDSFTMDYDATLAALKTIQAGAAETIATEAQFLKTAQVDLVLADIPPLAVPLAKAAGVPCWMLSNFGWDFIYRPWGGEFVAIADWISDCFQGCDRLFRLPFHEPMMAFPHITDVGLTGGDPAYDAAVLKAQWSIDAPRNHTVLLTFGGLGLAQIPYETLKQFPDWQFISFDGNAPELPNLLKVRDQRYRPVDVMPLCGRIISKPGYGTFAEACRLGIPIATLTRAGFAESPILIEGLRHHNGHQIIDPEAFFAGDWSFLKERPNAPLTEQVLDRDGNGAIAQAVIDYLSELRE
jgi:hypothetical protein